MSFFETEYIVCAVLLADDTIWSVLYWCTTKTKT